MSNLGVHTLLLYICNQGHTQDAVSSERRVDGRKDLKINHQDQRGTGLQVFVTDTHIHNLIAVDIGEWHQRTHSVLTTLL